MAVKKPVKYPTYDYTYHPYYGYQYQRSYEERYKIEYEIVWRNFNGSFKFAQLLPNGNAVVATDGGEALEISKQTRSIWKYVT